MTHSQLPGSDHVSRRSVLKTVGLSTTVGGLARRVQPDTEGYVLEQGDTCVPIEPLSGDAPVEEFYDYSIRRRFASEENGGRDPGSGPYYSSIGTARLQQPNTSLLFLYEGADGLSLVVVHGRAGDRASGGGSVSFTVSGLPSSGSWVVKDDRYRDQSTGELAATNYDRWSIDGTTHRIDWTWGTAATDGGAFSGLDSDPAIGIEPAFNEDAALWNQHYEGRVTDWQVLSGDPEDPDRTTLDTAAAVTIRAGTCTGQSGNGGSGGRGSDGSGDGSSGDGGTGDSDGNERSDRGNGTSDGQDGSNGEGNAGNDGNDEGKTGQEDEAEDEQAVDHREEHREEHREWNEEHQELHHEWQEEHRELHREKDEEEEDDWQEEHEEMHREWNEEHQEVHHEWQEEHRELHRELADEEDDD